MTTRFMFPSLTLRAVRCMGRFDRPALTRRSAKFAHARPGGRAIFTSIARSNSLHIRTNASPAVKGLSVACSGAEEHGLEDRSMKRTTERDATLSKLATRARGSPSPDAIRSHHHGYVNTAGLSRLDPALPDRRGFPRPPRRATNMAGAARRPRKRSKTHCADLEGEACAGVALLPSGLAAVSAALLSVLRAGDHLLMTDSVYEPDPQVLRQDPEPLRHCRPPITTR